MKFRYKEHGKNVISVFLNTFSHRYPALFIIYLDVVIGGGRWGRIDTNTSKVRLKHEI